MAWTSRRRTCHYFGRLQSQHKTSFAWKHIRRVHSSTHKLNTASGHASFWTSSNGLTIPIWRLPSSTRCYFCVLQRVGVSLLCCTCSLTTRLVKIRTDMFWATVPSWFNLEYSKRYVKLILSYNYMELLLCAFHRWEWTSWALPPRICSPNVQ